MELLVDGHIPSSALGHLHRDSTQKITHTDAHAAMAHDCVGGRHMKIEVWQHEMDKVIVANYMPLFVGPSVNVIS